MEIKLFNNSYILLRRYCCGLLLIIMGLVISNVFLVFVVKNNDNTVILVPAELTESTKISREQSSVSYKTTWGLHLSLLLGNINYKNINFVKDNLSDLIDANIFPEFIEYFSKQSVDIYKDKISMSFEPISIHYEAEINTVYVTGKHFIKGISGGSKQVVRTYEFVIEIGNYKPIVKAIDAYDGAAKILNNRSSN